MIAEMDFRRMGRYLCGRAIVDSALAYSGQLRVGHPDIGSGMGAVGWNMSCSCGGVDNRAISCVRQALAEYTCLV